MPFIDINTCSLTQLHQVVSTHPNIVACLCAAWCDVCTAYRPQFEALAQQHPELLFLWIDIEDQASLVGDMEVENFPTILIQHDDVVTFYGTMEPSTTMLKRLIQAQAGQTVEELKAQVSVGGKRLWQVDANLVLRLTKAK